MSIESTKKIIATIIVVIMMLGITTPTMAATKKDSDLKDTLGGLVNVATGTLNFVTKTAAPALSNLTTSLKNVDTSAAIDFAKNAGTTILENLNGFRQTTLPAIGGTEKTESIFEDIIGAVTQGEKALENIFKTDGEDKKIVEDFKVLGQGIEKMKSEAKGILEGIRQKTEGKETIGKESILTKIINIDEIIKKKQEIEERAGQYINNLGGNQNLVTDIKDKLANMFNFNKDETAENKETSETGNIINKIETEKNALKESIEQENGFFKGILSYFKNKAAGANTVVNGDADNKLGSIKEKADYEKAKLDAAIEASGGSKIKGFLQYLKGNVQETKTNVEVGVAETKNNIQNTTTEAKTLFECMIQEKGLIKGIKKYQEEKSTKAKIEQINAEKSEYYVAQKIVENGYEEVRRTQEVKEGEILGYTKNGEKCYLYLKELNSDKAILTGQDKNGNEIEIEISNFYELGADEGSLVLLEGVNYEFVLPVDPQGIDVSREGELAEYGAYPESGEEHMAVDFNTETGDPIYAVREGTVKRVGWNNDGGNYVEIEHEFNGKKYTSYYSHNEEILVEEGEYVGMGDKIAISGNTGNNTTGDHCHFTLKDENNEKLNPEEFKEIYTDNVYIEEVETGEVK